MSAPQTKEAAIAASGGSIHEFRKTTRKMRWWYESLADFMIANPSATQNEMAAHFGRNPATISTVIATDAFKAYFRQRRAHHAEKLDSVVRDKLFTVASKSLDHMLETLDKKRDTIPLEMLARVSESSLKNLGYGASPPGGAVTVNVGQAPQSVHVAVSLTDLEQAREALRRSQAPQLVDVTPTSDTASVRDLERPGFAGGATELSPLGDGATGSSSEARALGAGAQTITPAEPGTKDG